jgi:hypothetical protein
LRSNIKTTGHKLKLKDRMIDHLKRKRKESNYTASSSSNSQNQKFHSDKNIPSASVAVPRWLPDKIIKNCLNCQSRFGFFKRRHHCRVCGNIFCGNCTDKYESFPPFYEEKVRVCDECFHKKNFITK